VALLCVGAASFFDAAVPLAPEARLAVALPAALLGGPKSRGRSRVKSSFQWNRKGTPARAAAAANWGL
jgi:hypothetical protein